MSVPEPVPFNVTQVPLNVNYPWYNFTTVLSGTTYTIEVFYNTRADRWRMHIYDITGTTPLLMGIPLLIMRDLTRPYRYLQIPQGFLIAIDGDNKNTQPGLSAFVLNHALLYMEVNA